MSTKTNFKDEQANRYEFFSGGKHTHDFYDSRTGKMGSHFENTSAEDKKWLGHKSYGDAVPGKR